MKIDRRDNGGLYAVLWFIAIFALACGAVEGWSAIAVIVVVVAAGCRDAYHCGQERAQQYLQKHQPQ